MTNDLEINARLSEANQKLDLIQPGASFWLGFRGLLWLVSPKGKGIVRLTKDRSRLDASRGTRQLGLTPDQERQVVDLVLWLRGWTKP